MLREIRLCSFVTAELDGGELDGALCFDDFDGDGEDEVAVGTVTGRLSVFKYHASSQADDRVTQRDGPASRTRAGCICASGPCVRACVRALTHGTHHLAGSCTQQAAGNRSDSILAEWRSPNSPKSVYRDIGTGHTIGR